ncbi:uncharacterized protein LY79DRAFT_61639 [Colletotrichum navitas]|uniref:Uncharacterized protein n=1 Tax=Colletotrichum navitas TaxID=681940 RepID=A0AAD8Q846_9PEZI|nr:uncharacterized protein LY79DRAFT_61639 [Colletotrichum navitas]KAK1596339.1 hypothetical protein LY79DRAFT_61639 [Colletotrichum navitas]
MSFFVYQDEPFFRSSRDLTRGRTILHAIAKFIAAWLRLYPTTSVGLVMCSSTLVSRSPEQVRPDGISSLFQSGISRDENVLLFPISEDDSVARWVEHTHRRPRHCRARRTRALEPPERVVRCKPGLVSTTPVSFFERTIVGTNCKTLRPGGGQKNA